jgi:hypothetical protein
MISFSSLKKYGEKNEEINAENIFITAIYKEYFLISTVGRFSMAKWS